MKLCEYHDCAFLSQYAAIEGTTLHNDMRIKIQYDPLSDVSPSDLKSLITISYGVNNTVSVPEARFSVEEDPSGYGVVYTLNF